MKGILLWFFCGASRAVTRAFVLSWRTNRYIFPHRTLFQFMSPLPSKVGRQPCWVACLLVCVSGSHHGVMVHKTTAEQLLWSPPVTQRRGATLACGRGGGGAQFGRLDREPGTMNTLVNSSNYFYLLLLRLERVQPGVGKSRPST